MKDTRFTEELFIRAMGGDLAGLRAVPKAELHAHALLSAPFAIYEALAEGLARPPDRFFGFSDFDGYIFGEFGPKMRSPEKIRRIFSAGLDHMVQDGVVYAEISFDCSVPKVIGLQWPEMAAFLRAELDRVSPVLTVRLDAGLARGMHGKDWQSELLAALETGIFSGVDLYGDECSCGVTPFLSFFDIARAGKLRVKLHTGERRDAEEVLAELLAVMPDAVQHGVTGWRHAGVIDHYVSRNLSVNICPTSNVRLGVASSYDNHPIRALFDAGVRVTINTDDLAIFGASLSDEYLNLYRAGVFDAAELDTIRLNGLSARY